MFEYRAIVKSVYDGDTMTVDIDLGFGMWYKDQKIRLNGIDAPEKRTRDPLEKKCGLLATNIVKSFCPENSKITVATHLDKKGKFGRILGDILSERDNVTVNVNQYLVENRYAVAYHGQSKEDIKDEHKANFQYLIENGEIIE